MEDERRCPVCKGCKVYSHGSAVMHYADLPEKEGHVIRHKKEVKRWRCRECLVTWRDRLDGVVRGHRMTERLYTRLLELIRQGLPDGRVSNITGLSRATVLLMRRTQNG